jgi:hypothetical protein
LQLEFILVVGGYITFAVLIVERNWGTSGCIDMVQFIYNCRCDRRYLTEMVSREPVGQASVRCARSTRRGGRGVPSAATASCAREKRQRLKKDAR